jgi:hypothetical protein
MARPPKYTLDRADRIAQGISAGLSKHAASSLGAVTEDTLARWEKRYAGFAAKIAHAEAEAEARYIGVIAKAAFGHEVVERKEVHKENGDVEVTVTTRHEYDWQAARWWLSRRRRQDWGDRLDITLHGEIENLIAQLQGLDDPAPESKTLH